MDKADIAREKVSLLPVRELITVTDVRPIFLAGHEKLFLIKGYLFSQPIEQRHLRTMDGWKASACQTAIGLPPLYLTWQRDPFNKMAWNEHNLLNVEMLA